MVMEFVIEKLEAHWSQIEIELGPREWARFARQYRDVSALDAQDTEAFIRQLRELMGSTPCTERLWERWREEADFTRINESIEVWGRVAKGRERRLEQLADRYRDLGASISPLPSALAPAQPISDANRAAPAERN